MSRPPRLLGFDYLGPYQYFLTFCTLERRATFLDSGVVAVVLMQFRRTAQTAAFVILAYCLMPDHVHLLVEGSSETSDLRRFAKRAKQSAAQAYSHRFKGRLWQEGYYDRVLRPGEDPRVIARYIVENPVRAGLVRSALEYPHVGSDVWSLEELILSVQI
jgi:putative transposase